MISAKIHERRIPDNPTKKAARRQKRLRADKKGCAPTKKAARGLSVVCTTMPLRSLLGGEPYLGGRPALTDEAHGTFPGKNPPGIFRAGP